MTRSSRRRVLIALLLGLALATSACGDALFIRDRRVDALRPSPGSTVGLPITIEWGFHEIDVVEPGTPGGLYFAVFVDRVPIAPGASLLDIVDESCRRSGGGCADRAYFAERGVYLTGKPSVRIDALANRTSRKDHRVLHDVDIVLIGDDHRRIGEAVWTTSFRIRAAES